MAFLLDTNAVSEVLNKRPNEGVVRWFGEIDENFQFISAFSIGEIQKGISKLPESRRRTELQTWFEDLQNRYGRRILSFEITTARILGKMIADLEFRGQPLPIIDSLIAATALEHDLTVVTRNTADFSTAKLKVINIWE